VVEESQDREKKKQTIIRNLDDTLTSGYFGGSNLESRVVELLELSPSSNRQLPVYTRISSPAFLLLATTPDGSGIKKCKSKRTKNRIENVKKNRGQEFAQSVR
jgi:hypothetical protein